MSVLREYVWSEENNKQWKDKKGREGRRILGKKDGETACAALIRLWGQRQEDWRERHSAFRELITTHTHITLHGHKDGIQKTTKAPFKKPTLI